MITKEEAKERIRILVDKFERYGKDKLDSMPEEDIKYQFIEPLLEALGWEREDISKETRILKGRADYILKSGNQELVVVEAKKTNVHFTDEEGKQAVSYAYHRKIKFAVLTNFKYVYVYHALSNIKNISKNLLKIEGDYFRFEFKEFGSKFDTLWLLSKESFQKGETSKLLSSKDERLNKPIDKNILENLLEIRGALSKDLKSRKNYLDKSVIDEVVQVLIDRLIFIRSVEDRGLEPMNYLRSFESDVRQQRTKLQLFPYLLTKFEEFNDKYDSKFFEMGVLEKEGAFSDEVLREVILKLYFGSDKNQERYLFDQIPGDLFGSIYEQYLGTILSETEKRVKLSGESGKRKKMGIYYTPSYIVEYIVKNTVYEYIKDKTIDEILEVKILDPACGSGSFITRAFKEVCDVVEDKFNRGESGTKILFKNPGKKIDKLSLGQKIEIMKSCIFGVDLDEKAIELAKLNLLLKLLDEETQETKKMLLPHLESNIKNGNSLIDDPKVAGDKAFNWRAQFSDVFREGGFDIVIGNPPYIRVQNLDKKEINYFKNAYDCARSSYDIYVLFVELGHKLLKKSGELGYILPNKFFNADYGESIREFLLKQRCLREIVDFKDHQIFESATTYTCLLFLENRPRENFNYCFPIDLKRLITGSLLKENISCHIQKMPISKESWSFSNRKEGDILNKLNEIKVKLGDLAESMFQGVVTSADPVYICKLIKEDKDFFYVTSSETKKNYKLEKEVVKRLLKGNDIRRYVVNRPKHVLIFPYDAKEGKLIDIRALQKYEGVWSYLEENKKRLEDRESGKMKRKDWYAYVYPKNRTLFEKRKILTQVLSNSNKFVLDDKGEYYFVGGGNAGGYGITLKEPYGDKDKLILGILNSRILEFYIKSISSRFRGGYYSYAKRFIEKVPLKIPEGKQEKLMASLIDEMLKLQLNLKEKSPSGNEKERLEQQIKNVDYEIDQEVYKLYGITAEEQKIIEDSLK